MASSVVNQALVGLGCVLTYIICLVVYRLYFSPLAKFPGPKIAALTSLYGFYHDVHRGGQYHWVIEDMHKKYGPIVRIRPEVLHINDPEFIDPLYGTPGKRRDKYKIAINGYATSGSGLGTMHHDLHRGRRAALNPFFSKQSVRRLEPILHRTLAKLLRNLSAGAKSGEPMNIHLLYNAATSDIIYDYCFGESANNLDRADLNEQFFSAFHEAGRGYHFACYNPWFVPIMRFLPMRLMSFLMPDIRVFLELLQTLTKKVNEVKESQKLKTEMAPTIFHGLLTNPNLPDSEKVTDRLLDEARTLIGGGTDTTAFTLSCLTYHVLSNPHIIRILRAELADAIPNPEEMPQMAQLEALPYLTAVIQETIRLHPAASVRQERVAPDEDIFYESRNSGNKYVIPKGTPVGMSPHMLSRNEDIYPSWSTFDPDRWVENPRLDRYQLAFSRGSRRCLGMNLAYSELYLITAGLFRKYDLHDRSKKQNYPTFELFETSREDVDMVADFVLQYVREGSHGVRVKVRSGEE